MKKGLKAVTRLILVLLVFSVFLTGCTGNAGNDGTDTTIMVVSREDGSGTRGAFIELLGIEKKDANGNKVDRTTDEATIVNSTSIVMTTVAGNDKAIGYISLGSLNDTVKALKVDGAAATIDNIKSNSYKVFRPFNIATKGEGGPVTKDFIDFILSSEGQKVVEDNGYISAGDNGAYSGSKPSGKVVVAGSSSVTPVMEKLKEAYQVVNPGANIEVQMSDSSTGMKSAIDGTCDIGMASRELKDSEKEDLDPTVVALDGIAVIVNKDSSIDNIKSEDIMAIYTGDITAWDEVK